MYKADLTLLKHFGLSVTAIIVYVPIEAALRRVN
jgi:hypothetical protein